LLPRPGRSSIGVKWLSQDSLYAEPSHFGAGSMSVIYYIVIRLVIYYIVIRLAYTVSIKISNKMSVNQKKVRKLIDELDFDALKQEYESKKKSIHLSTFVPIVLPLIVIIPLSKLVPINENIYVFGMKIPKIILLLVMFFIFFRIERLLKALLSNIRNGIRS